jgi:hypothetical protein
MPARAVHTAIRPVAHSGWKPDATWQSDMDKLPWQGEKPTCWRKGLLAAVVSRDEIEPGDHRWHVSIQHRDRVPTWEEMSASLHELRPGVAFALGVPPRSWWINVHPNVLHGWELRDGALIAQWRAERRGDRPS